MTKPSIGISEIVQRAIEEGISIHPVWVVDAWSGVMVRPGRCMHW